MADHPPVSRSVSSGPKGPEPLHRPLLVIQVRQPSGWIPAPSPAMAGPLGSCVNTFEEVNGDWLQQARQASVHGMPD